MAVRSAALLDRHGAALLRRQIHKWDKPPFDPRTGQLARSDNPATWSSFTQALAAYQRGDYDGIGFVLHAQDTEADSLIGIDLDKCRDPATGAVEPWALAIIADLDTYTELSPSGTGIRLFVRGRIPTGGRRKARIEVYQSGRYLTVTGQPLEGRPDAVADRPAKLTAFYDRFFGPQPSAGIAGTPLVAARQPRDPDRDDDELLERAVHAANGDKFRGLWNGDTTGYASASEADLALCNLLAFWTGPDPARIDRLVRRSGLMRDKWDERHYADGRTYGQGTIATALKGRTEFYTGATMYTNTSQGLNLTGLSGQLPHEWPAPMGGEAFYGLAGEIVRCLEPHSEADPVALLGQLLVTFGSAIGRTAHFLVENTQHFGNEFLLLIGPTASGAKGTAWGRIRQLMQHVDAEWTQQRVRTGMCSGEGLIWHVRDPSTEPVKPNNRKGQKTSAQGNTDPGVGDKRLLAIEEEFAQVLINAARRGSTLGTHLRHSWDSVQMETLGKGKPARVAEPHVSLIAHCTEADLDAHLARTDCRNGFANRFLFACVKRSKELPHGGNPNPPGLEEMQGRLREALAFGRTAGERKRDAQANQLWEQHYHALNTPPPGLAGALLARAKPHVMRLANLFSLLDRSPQIRAPHLQAALAFWDYCTRSVHCIFGDVLGDPVADTIEDALRRAPEGLSREQINNLFCRNRTAAEISRGLVLLHSLGRAYCRKLSKGSKPGARPEVWYFGPEPQRRYEANEGNEVIGRSASM